MDSPAPFSDAEATLSDNERAMVRQFLTHTSEMPGNHSLINEALAQKFLMARKWDMIRASKLFQKHVEVYEAEDLLSIDPYDPEVNKHLMSGKFVVPNTTDKLGSKAVFFLAAKHTPNKAEHHSNLQSVVFLLNCITDDIITQRRGLTFVFDMTHAGWGNLDLALFKAIMDLLQNVFPCRLSRALILNAPWWIRTTLRMFTSFLSDKMSSRVALVDSLLPFMVSSAIPAVVSEGTLPYDEHVHRAVILGLINARRALVERPIVVQRADGQAADAPPMPLRQSVSGGAKPMARTPTDLPPPVVGEPPVRMRPKVVAVAPAPQLDDSNPFAEMASAGMANPNVRQSVAEPGQRAAALPKQRPMSEFFDHPKANSKIMRANLRKDIEKLQFSGLILTQFVALQEQRYPTDFFHANANKDKNRYCDILPYDHSRVILAPVKGNPRSEYINANFVHGYDKERAFIAAQGPLPHTSEDFWRMVWQYNSRSIVMATRELERGRPKCHVYWPEAGQHVQYGDFVITCTSSTGNDDYLIRELNILDINSDKSRPCTHLQFISWPDHGVPPSAKPVLQLLQKVDTIQASTPDAGPIVVHCSAGIGRTGTFITIHSSLRQLAAEGSIDVFTTVLALRHQRYGMVQTPDQYEFCYQAILEAATATTAKQP